jgi:hypothetical protein
VAVPNANCGKLTLVVVFSLQVKYDGLETKYDDLHGWLDNAWGRSTRLRKSDKDLWRAVMKLQDDVKELREERSRKRKDVAVEEDAPKMKRRRVESEKYGNRIYIVIGHSEEVQRSS